MDRTADYIPYTSFTEKTANIQWIISSYHEEILGLACPISAGWPALLEPILRPNTTVIGFDLNKAQISWYLKANGVKDNIIIYNGDISLSDTELSRAIDQTNFWFVSNIPDWLAGVTGRADRTTIDEHNRRISGFVNRALEYLSQGSYPRFLLVSSLSEDFLRKLEKLIIERIDNRLVYNVRYPEPPLSWNSMKHYPINSYLLIEVAKKD